MADRAAAAETQAPPWPDRVAGALAGLGVWRALATAMALGALAAGALPPLYALPLPSGSAPASAVGRYPLPGDSAGGMHTLEEDS